MRQELKAAVEKLRVGDPFTRVDFGPLVSQEQWESYTSCLEESLVGGGRLVAEAPVLVAAEERSTGYYAPPVVISSSARSPPTSPTLPILYIHKFASIEEVAEAADGGLAGILTHSPQVAGPATILQEFSRIARARTGESLWVGGHTPATSRLVCRAEEEGWGASHPPATHWGLATATRSCFTFNRRFPIAHTRQVSRDSIRMR